MSPDAAAALRARLVTLRSGALARLAELDHVDVGLLALASNANAALYVLDAMPDKAAEAVRVIATDDGREIRLTLYDLAGAVAAVPISPRRAMLLASDLLQMGLRHTAWRAADA